MCIFMQIYVYINDHAQTCIYTCVSTYDNFRDIIYVKIACKTILERTIMLKKLNLTIWNWQNCQFQIVKFQIYKNSEYIKLLYTYS